MIPLVHISEASGDTTTAQVFKEAFRAGRGSQPSSSTERQVSQPPTDTTRVLDLDTPENKPLLAGMRKCHGEWDAKKLKITLEKNNNNNVNTNGCKLETQLTDYKDEGIRLDDIIQIFVFVLV